MDHPLYGTWQAMIARCYRKTHTAYKSYGARGIRVAQVWIDSFEQFVADMGPRPSPKHTVDRKDGAKGYYPENCRWATRLEQHANKHSNKFFTINGKTQHLAAWLRELGISEGTYGSRIRLGWDPVEAITTPIRS